MKKNILITDRFSLESLLYLQRQTQFQVIQSPHPFHIPQELLVEAHALIIRSKTPITEELLSKARQLQLIVTTTSGFDHIDLEATQKWGVTVMHTPMANQESAAQLTWGLVLQAVNNLQQGFEQVKKGHWQRDLITGRELSSLTYGIIGLGRIGQKVAKLAKAFNMNVIAYDPYQEDEVFENLNLPRMSYEEVLKSADIISFHVPKTLETEYMLNRSHLEYIQRGVILINTSRGSVIKENDLVEALRQGWIRAVGLDVFEKEPLSPQSNLLQYKNVFCTPHIGANTEEAFYKASEQGALKVVQFFTDGSTTDSLPPRVSWYGATPFQSRTE